MSDAREILKQRLAKGEISPEEFTQLSALMDSSPEISDGATAKAYGAPIDVQPPPAPVTRKGKNGWVRWIVGGGVIALIGMGLSNISSGKVEILNLRSSGFFGDVISGRLYTEGGSGTVYVWVEAGGKRMCPRRTYIVSKQATPFEFTCSELQNGKFTLMSNRMPDDWVKNNAMSL